LYANYIRKKYITKLPVAKELPGIIWNETHFLNIILISV
jgi:hypothetical protein